MSNVLAEIEQLEDELCAAERKPDAEFFERFIDDDAVLVGHDGHAYFAKQAIVAAHRPDSGSKFTNVQVRDREIIEHETAGVVSCRTTFETDQGKVTLRFVRVWLRKAGAWKLIGGCVYK